MNDRNYCLSFLKDFWMLVNLSAGVSFMKALLIVTASKYFISDEDLHYDTSPQNKALDVILFRQKDSGCTFHDTLREFAKAQSA